MLAALRSFRSAALRTLVGVLLVGIAAAAIAQGGPSRSVDLQLGFGDAIVADAWNPLRVRTRDVPRAVLELTVDQGSLRDGEVPLVYRAPVGGPGLTVHDDDLWIPAWRSIVWTVRSGERVWASGTIGTRQRDERPLDLVLTRDPGAYRNAFAADARIVEIAAADLPARGAAWDGVRSLLLDGTAAAPRSDAVAAAAAMGVRVVLVTPLPSSHDELLRLAALGRAGLGAGAVVPVGRAGVAGVLSAIPTFDTDAALELLAERLRVRPPPLPGTTSVLAALLGYGLAALVLVRFGRLPGLVAVLGLAGLLSFAAWRGLRPEQTTYEDRAVLEVSAGGLAVRGAIADFLTLPAGRLELPTAVRVAPLRRALTTPDGTELLTQRWSRDRVALRPTLAVARLERATNAVRAGPEAVTDVWVVGTGSLGSLAPGEVRLVDQGDPEGDPPGAVAPLLGGLAPGTAVAVATDGAVLLARAPAPPALAPGASPPVRRSAGGAAPAAIPAEPGATPSNPFRSGSASDLDAADSAAEGADEDAVGASAEDGDGAARTRPDEPPATSGDGASEPDATESEGTP